MYVKYYHLQQVAESGELDLSKVCKKILLNSERTSNDEVIVYNLDDRELKSDFDLLLEEIE